MNENNLAMEEMLSSEDKPSPSQPMDGADYDTDSDDYCVLICLKLIGYLMHTYYDIWN
jgi:hypothetical protein